MSAIIPTLISLGSRPPPFCACFNYAHEYAANIRRTGKAWAETSREGRRGVDAWRRGTSFSRYQAFLTPFLADSGGEE